MSVHHRYGEPVSDVQALTVPCPLCHRAAGWPCVYGRPTRETPEESIDPEWCHRVRWAVALQTIDHPLQPKSDRPVGHPTVRPHNERRTAFAEHAWRSDPVSTSGYLAEWLRRYGDIFEEREVTELSEALARLRAKLTESTPFAETKTTQRTWYERAGGWKTAARCPRCGAEVVYNGNYFCADWNAGRCRWALPHPAISPSDRRVCDVVGIGYD